MGKGIFLPGITERRMVKGRAVMMRGQMWRRAAFLGMIILWGAVLASCGGSPYRQYDVELYPEARAAESAFWSGEYDRALELYGVALKNYETSGDDMGVLYCLEKMGWIHREMGNYGEALELFRRAYPIGVRLNGDAAEIDSSLGDVFLFSGDSERARSHYFKALDTLEDFEFPTSYRRPPSDQEKADLVRKVKAIVHARENLGTLNFFKGDYDEALYHLNEAEKLIDRVLYVADHRFYGLFFQPPLDLYEGIGFCHTIRGAVYGELGLLDQALPRFKKGRDAFVKSGREYGLLVNRALQYKAEFQSEGAIVDESRIAEYDSFLEEVDLFGALDIAWRMSFEIGRALAREGMREQARNYLALAINALEMTRTRLREDTVKKVFASSVQDVYAEMIELLFRMNRFEEGFDYLERAKARSFLDMLAGRSVDAVKEVDDLLVMKERELQGRLDNLSLQLRMTIGPERREIHKTYSDTLKERERVLEAIKGQSLEYAATTTVTTVPLRRIASRLDERTALISFFPGVDQVLAWVVFRGNVSAVRVDTGAQALSDQVTRFRGAVEALDEKPVEEAGANLALTLIHPLEGMFEGADRLYIVPGGVLHHLPFAVLPSSKGRYLVQDYTVSILPNASSLFFLDKEVTSDTTRLMAFGNPERDDDSTDLIFAEKEVTSIARHFFKPKVLTGPQATETALKEDLLDTGIIHIAAHGWYNSREPLKSALLLAPDELNDGDLDMVEVFSLRMNPRLVVLSACESGIGSLEGGDEIQGMNRAFLYAGAGGVLASLWSVSDESTYKLMEYFYSSLQGKPAAEALRKAQLSLMQEYPAPFHWGAFYLTGFLDQ